MEARGPWSSSREPGHDGKAARPKSDAAFGEFAVPHPSAAEARGLWSSSRRPGNDDGKAARPKSDAAFGEFAVPHPSAAEARGLWSSSRRPGNDDGKAARPKSDAAFGEFAVPPPSAAATPVALTRRLPRLGRLGSCRGLWWESERRDGFGAGARPPTIAGGADCETSMVDNSLTELLELDPEDDGPAMPGLGSPRSSGRPCRCSDGTVLGRCSSGSLPARPCGGCSNETPGAPWWCSPGSSARPGGRCSDRIMPIARRCSPGCPSARPCG